VAGPPAGIQLAAARIGTGVFVFDLSYVSHPWSGLSNGTPIFPQSKADPAGIACASPCAHRTRCEKLELITLRCKQRSGIISGGALCRVAAVSACRSVHSCWITAHKTSRAPLGGHRTTAFERSMCSPSTLRGFCASLMIQSKWWFLGIRGKAVVRVTNPRLT